MAPSIATNNRMVLKPSEKTPLTALLLADVLYEAGLPREMFQVVTGDPKEIADAMLTDPNVDLITFTGGVSVGKYIAKHMGYRRAVLELGGNDPLIVMEDADIDEAATLAVAGSYKNSGQRCTAVKRMIVHGGRRRPLRRAAAGEDQEDEVRRSHGSRNRHGHRDRRSPPRSIARTWSTTRSRPAPSCCTATSARARSIRRPWSITCPMTASW